MFRLFIGSLLLSAFMLVDMPQSEARVISLRNPSRSVNLTGVNYGSMRWERLQGNRGTVFGRSYRRGVFRRR